MYRATLRFGTLLAALGLAACDLEVINENNPETDRVLQTPLDVEALLGGQYLRWHTGLYGSSTSIRPQASVMAFEHYSGNANFGMVTRAGIPRGSVDNSVGNAFSAEHRRAYTIDSESARTTANVLSRLNAPGFTLGSTARDQRARAFAEFVRGLSLGYIALIHDSGAVIHPDLPTTDPGELVGYKELMAAAIDALDKAIAASQNPGTGANGFPIPTAWLPTPTALTASDFIRLVRSYRARFRANVARTPAERAAVDWDAVIADAENGITADHINVTNTVTGPFNAWIRQHMEFTNWSQMTPFILGMGDVSGGYDAWLATPIEQRDVFLIVSPDLRLPQGATRAAQQADLAIPYNPATSLRYFRNRPTGNDAFPGQSWGWSNYDHVRFHDWAITKGQNGDFPFFVKAELDLLAAEGHYRKGNYAAAAALINKTRTKNGLPAITAFDATSPVPGGANCVPRVPVGPNYTSTACGTMLEALKWEKRLETAYTAFGAWFFDSRGWGDLAQNTALEWPVPFEDLQARGRPVYSLGGGGASSAPKGTYGF